MTFEIKKYIRNSGKSDYLAGKNTLFQAVVVSEFKSNSIYVLQSNLINKTFRLLNQKPTREVTVLGILQDTCTMFGSALKY